MPHQESYYRPDTELKEKTEKNQEIREEVLEWFRVSLSSLEELVKNKPDSENEEREYLPDIFFALIPDLEYDKFSLNRNFILVLKKLIKVIESAETIDIPHDKKINSKEFSISIRPKHLLYLSDYRGEGNYRIYKNNTVLINGYAEPNIHHFAEKGEFFEVTDPKEELSIKGYDSFYNREKPTSFKILVETIISEEPITIDTILHSWSKEKIRDFLYQKKHMVEELRNRYVSETKTVLLYGEALDILKEYDSSDIVSDSLRRTKKEEVKKILFPFKHFTCAEAMEDIQKQLLEKDTFRYNLHRKIEAFFEVFEGKNKIATAASLELAMLEQEKSVKIFGQISMLFPRKSEWLSTPDPLEIEFGISERYTSVYYDSNTPAKTPSYQSFISPDRDRGQDILLANNIITKFQSLFPTLKIENDLEVRGSFHEKFSGTGLKITQDSIERQAEESDMDISTLIDEIKKIIRTEIEQERTSNIAS